MEQFNLQKYLENPGRKIVTYDGRSVRIVCTDMKTENYPIIALIENLGGKEFSMVYTPYGISGNGFDSINLFFAPIKKEGWINIYHYDGIENANAARRIYDTKEEALSCKNKGYVDTVKIKWEE